MKLGFIGAGNMGGAIIKGFIKSGKISAKDINVVRKNESALKEMADELGIIPCSNYSELVENSDVIFMAVKPVMFESVLNELSPILKNSNKLLVSMAAGLTTDSIEKILGFEYPIVRIMPNINAEILMSATAICKNAKASNDDMDYVKDLFSAIGLATEVAENQFAVFTAIAGCSPAYVYLFIDSLAKGAQKMGMQKAKALEIAATAVIGSAAMYQQSNSHPWELIDKVCSPGGTTIEGVCTLEEYKFESGIVKAVENSVLKDYALNKK
jgi:pyrroline-5-carboxylate reductase